MCDCVPLRTENSHTSATNQRLTVTTLTLPTVPPHPSPPSQHRRQSSTPLANSPGEQDCAGHAPCPPRHRGPRCTGSTTAPACEEETSVGMRVCVCVFCDNTKAPTKASQWISAETTSARGHTLSSDSNTRSKPPNQQTTAVNTLTIIHPAPLNRERTWLDRKTRRKPSEKASRVWP